MMSIYVIVPILAILVILGVIVIRRGSISEPYSASGSWYENGVGFTAFDDKLPNYENPPNLKTAIGGAKSEFSGAHGLYEKGREHLASGTPNRARATRTILKPESIGFSANSIVNRNYYDDLYNNVGDRKPNPLFKYITKERGMLNNPVKYAEPQYRFAAI